MVNLELWALKIWPRTERESQCYTFQETKNTRRTTQRDTKRNVTGSWANSNQEWVLIPLLFCHIRPAFYI